MRPPAIAPPSSLGWRTAKRKRVGGESDGESRYLAHEFGLVRFDRITTPSLTAADDYFQNTEPYWTLVRNVWSKTLADHDRFGLRAEAHGRKLFEKHFAHADKLAAGEPFGPANAEQHARATIESFLELLQKSRVTIRF